MADLPNNDPDNEPLVVLDSAAEVESLANLEGVAPGNVLTRIMGLSREAMPILITVVPTSRKTSYRYLPGRIAVR